MKTLQQANIEVLQQVSHLVDCCDTKYTHSAHGATSSIGRHVRHILDHYRALQDGLDHNLIDYNQRCRNHTEETDAETALQSLQAVIGWLHEPLEDRQLAVISEISVSRQYSESVQSQLSRELLYLINHTVHHTAYATLLAHNIGIEVPEYMGLAPATASFQRAQTIPA